MQATKETTQGTLNLNLPQEVVEIISRIAMFHDQNLDDLIFSYIVDGIAKDAWAARRIQLTEKPAKNMDKVNGQGKTVDYI